MNGPVADALSASPELEGKYTAFRDAAHRALGEDLTAQVRHAVAEVHGIDSDPPTGQASQAVLAYVRRIPFEHTAISDEEAARIVDEIGEERYVALSVVAALADAECRARLVDLPGLAR
ncbi:hypothetical protein [Erythrobacter sp.]|uniref:hypothetical protein n=1 Tax=Erythrobacter sp. TaxID=1042 RepID=UPI003C74E92E